MALQKQKKSLSKNKLGIIPNVNKGEPIRRKHKALVVILIAMVITIAAASVVRMVKTQQINQNKLEQLIKDSQSNQDLQLKVQNENTQNRQQKLEEQIEELKKQVKIKKESKIAQAAQTTLQAATPKAQAASGTCQDWMNQAGITDQANANILIMRESGCNPRAVNPTSGACGISQALPCSKMGPVNADGTSAVSPVGQLQWMNSYVMARYGSWERALDFWHCLGNCTSKIGTVYKTATWY